jgi:RNA polymerase sigma-70 factor (ECF subfamily)
MESSLALEQHVEAELLARVARQDSEAFGCFYDRTSAVLFGIAKSIVRDEKAEVFDPALGKPISWAIALTRNRALDKLRGVKRRDAGTRRLEVEWTDAPIPDAASALDAQEISQILQEAMKKLDAKKREAIQLAFLKGLPHAEIAEVLQQPLGTVKAWIRRGMLELRIELSEVLPR